MVGLLCTMPVPVDVFLLFGSLLIMGLASMYVAKWATLHSVSRQTDNPIFVLSILNLLSLALKLVNAASKGYISIVEYLLDEAHANPLLKNHIGEAAYDASAASREAYICEILEKAGKKWWHTQQMEGKAP